jgi:hypothetical protein
MGGPAGCGDLCPRGHTTQIADENLDTWMLEHRGNLLGVVQQGAGGDGLLFALGLIAAPANAANQISGTALLIPSVPDEQCPDEPTYPDYSAIVMTGSLEGCWYTKILTFKQTPSGVYLESGEELFVGSLNGGPRAASPQPINSRPS